MTHFGQPLYLKMKVNVDLYSAIDGRGRHNIMHINDCSRSFKVASSTIVLFHKKLNSEATSVNSSCCGYIPSNTLTNENTI